MSAIEILMKCQERNLRINKTTVYRELHFFLKQKIIHEVHVFTDQALFESSYQPHHHHLICDKCHAIIDMPFQGVEQYIQNITRNARQTRGFFVQSHILELFGICNSCNVSALC
jgi:Fe2+ or Zn2+ uptake regulation protein